MWDSPKRRAEIAKWKKNDRYARGLGACTEVEEAQAGVHCVNFSKNNPATRDWRGRGWEKKGTGGWVRTRIIILITIMKFLVRGYFWSEGMGDEYLQRSRQRECVYSGNLYNKNLICLL